ncbi:MULTISPECIES: glycine cleavage system protein GcvH [unclassified Kitasatospora]|uniref:glycine cleavage system protein GcvH n=1 Tax=unclassified Kitasatospora TaxID=2633591 RepID=UPI000710CA14|nr:MULTISPECIES: glycine cleavage system protein GcvH [unclassified Kitasatospora]KQV14529.1 glycine cleavage system protein H [Kitasatospora sp. Root107]KRB68069.1 glycine cleavage system protein H [Kitasatospora sp. Root187]
MTYPTEYKYTKDHEWLLVDGKTASVGLTDFAQKQLGDIVFVEVATKEGTQLDAEEPFGSVESVKAVSEFFSPVSGKVVAINTLLSDEPDAINTDPHSTWIIKIEMSDVKQLDGLLTAAQYEQFITAED